MIKESLCILPNFMYTGTLLHTKNIVNSLIKWYLYKMYPLALFYKQLILNGLFWVTIAVLFGKNYSKWDVFLRKYKTCNLTPWWVTNQLPPPRRQPPCPKNWRIHYVVKWVAPHKLGGGKSLTPSSKTRH